MPPLLPTIEAPYAIKDLSEEEQYQLAEEVRAYMIDCVSKSGGHLAPSLGVVELTIALCDVFDFPRDKVIFDVGHQSYAFKILTGRRDRFPSIRQWQGLAGFPKSDESEYDNFNTGHSSTSLSAALGLATARDLKGEKHEVVAVIGDGALTGGLAYEAMNNIGASKKDLIVILNDNEMSISANVGAMANYLSRVRSSPRYSRKKERVKELFYRHRIGKKFIRGLSRIKDGVKYFLVRNTRGILFEELGFTYLGPIDGHDLQMMKHFMQNARSVPGPVMLHVITKKGKGYQPSENSPDQFHGVSPFDPESGKLITNGNGGDSYSKCFGNHLVRMAANDDRICAITAAMPDGTGLTPFSQRFPDRFFDVGIAESHAVTFAAGLAKEGLKPVVAIYSSFLQRGFDQVFHDVCLQKLPVTLAIDRSGIVGEDGETHQGLYDVALLRPMPNLVILAPSSAKEMEMMLAYAISQDSPCALRYPRGTASTWDVWLEHAPLALGKGEVIRGGQDVLLLPVGSMVEEALALSELLTKAGFSAEIINPRFIKPLDEELLSVEMAKFPLVVTMEDHVLCNGFGDAILELAQEYDLKSEIMRVGFPDQAIPHGKPRLLWEHYEVDATHVCERILLRLQGEESSHEKEA